MRPSNLPGLIAMRKARRLLTSLNFRLNKKCLPAAATNEVPRSLKRPDGQIDAGRPFFGKSKRLAAIRREAQQTCLCSRTKAVGRDLLFSLFFFFVLFGL